MNVGMVGFGMVAERFHARLLSAEPRLRWTHVVERHGRRAQELYPQVTTLASAPELFALDEIDVVVILTPNESHFPLAREALRASKHVVLDKPFTITSAQADELIALAGKMERHLTVFHNRRWDGDYLTVRALLDDGRLGQLRRYESRWERFRPQASGGWREKEGPGLGVLYDLGSHMLDQALQLFGKPRRLLAHLRVERQGVQAVDAFDLVADYGGFQAHISSGCLVAGPSYRFALFGESGTYLKEGLDPQEDQLRHGLALDSPQWGREARQNWGRLRSCPAGIANLEVVPTVAGCYQNFYSNLAATLRGQRTLSITPQEAREVIRGIELAEQSQREERWVAWS